MALSLLAHLYSYIRGSQEDVATLSLQYILKQSPDLNAAFTRLVSKALQVEPGEEIHYPELFIAVSHKQCFSA
jgi:hypothetical protein